MSLDRPDERTRREIEAVTLRLLREAGVAEPPVPVGRIVEHLELHRGFYDLQSPSFLDRAKHKIIIHGRKLSEMLRRIKLAAVLLYDEDRIVLDTQLPKIKHDWSTCHEVAHRVLPWHKTYFRGDTAETLAPDWHELLEAEANYGASEIMFCGPLFRQEARDLAPTWASVEQIAKRYGKSKTATLRRFVEHGPDLPMVMLVSTPYWEERPPDQVSRCRHCVPSPEFAQHFSSIQPDALLTLVDRHSQQRIGGPVADFTCALHDDAGRQHEFHVESFFNQHYILSLFTRIPSQRAHRIVVPIGVSLRRAVR